MTIHTMTCTTFDERLAEYLEGELTLADRRAVDAHIASCARCRALVRDLDQIRAGARQLPELTPSRDLWSGIAERIEAPVVPLMPRAVPNVAGRERLRQALVAAALVAVTAGVTYTLTVNSGARGARNLANAPSVVAPDSQNRRDLPNADTTPAPHQLAVDPTVTPVQPAPSVAAPATTQQVRNVAPSVTYSREIDRLRIIFTRNRAQLDPRTAAIIEANLKVIDDAIAQSKAALQQDPASRFLSDQLNSALDKKLELLRTAALLPSRT